MEELSNNPESPNVSEFEDDDKSNLNLENFVLVNEDGSYAETGKTVISSEKVPKISLTKSSKFMNNVIDSVSNSSTTNLAISSSKMPELVPIAENLDEIDRVRCTMCKKMMLFQTDTEFLRHLKTFHQGTRYSCYLCKRIFSDLSVLFIHLKDQHLVEEPERWRIALYNKITTRIIESWRLCYLAEPDLTIASDTQREAIMCQRDTDEMLFGDKNSAAHVNQHQKRKDVEKKMIEKVSKNVISISSDNREPLFQNENDDNLIFDESKTVSNTSTPNPDPEIGEQPEMIFDDFPEKSIPEVVSIDDKTKPDPEMIFDDFPEKSIPEVVSINDNDSDDSYDSEEIQEIAMADPLKEINTSNIQIVYETNDEDIEIAADEDLNMEVIEEKDEVILGTESPIPDSLVDQDFQITNVCSLQEEDPYDPQIQETDENSIDSENTQNDLIFLCPHCHSVPFSSFYFLDKHIKQHHASEEEKYEFIKNPVKTIDNVRVCCNICNGIIYRDEIPRHFSKLHRKFCIIKQWPCCEKCLLYFPDEYAYDLHMTLLHKLNITTTLGNSVANLPTGTSIEPRICVPALPTPPPQKKIKISCQNTPSTPKEWLKKGPSNETIKISNMLESPKLKPPNLNQDQVKIASKTVKISMMPPKGDKNTVKLSHSSDIKISSKGQTSQIKVQKKENPTVKLTFPFSNTAAIAIPKPQKVDKQLLKNSKVPSETINLD